MDIFTELVHDFHILFVKSSLFSFIGHDSFILVKLIESQITFFGSQEKQSISS